MTGLILASVVLVVYIVAKRKYDERKALTQYKKQREEKEGYTPEYAWIVSSQKAIDTQVRRERCFCGGKIWARSQSTLQDDLNVQVVVCECTRCEEVVRLYFEREYLN